MQPIKLTKAALKEQREELRRYERYLPTLRIKKQLLQREVARIDTELRRTRAESAAVRQQVDPWVELFAEEAGLESLLVLERVELRGYSVAGIDVPELVEVHFRAPRYDLVRTPLWIDRALAALRTLAQQTVLEEVLREQKRRLQRELHLVSQRVNLFERVKIPEKQRNIHRIAVHLGDQLIAAFGWALLAKRKSAAAEREAV